jgi:hypothetical protein
MEKIVDVTYKTFTWAKGIYSLPESYYELNQIKKSTEKTLY